jgi:hypothetical protein
MKVIINKTTKVIERETEFKNRFKGAVSFGPNLIEAVVSGLDPECTLAEVGEQPAFNSTFQKCYLREPFEIKGKLTTVWVVENKDKQEINRLFNDAIEAFIDSKAQALYYTNQDRMISYIGDPDLQTDQEARFMKSWRSECWIIAKRELDVILVDLEANPSKAIPSPEAITQLFPEFIIPSRY